VLRENKKFIATQKSIKDTNLSGTITTEKIGIGYYSHDIALVQGAIVERD
jgi:hypothetical protein